MTPGTGLVDAYALERMFGVQAATIRKWASRGRINRYGRDGRRTLYRIEEVEELVRRADDDAA